MITREVYNQGNEYVGTLYLKRKTHKVLPDRSIQYDYCIGTSTYLLEDCVDCLGKEIDRILRLKLYHYTYGVH